MLLRFVFPVRRGWVVDGAMSDDGTGASQASRAIHDIDFAPTLTGGLAFDGIDSNGPCHSLVFAQALVWTKNFM
jgi:hypothetical protein